MIMSMRWFGESYDSVRLEFIRQVPGVAGVITTIYNKLPGELWNKEEISNLVNYVNGFGLKVLGIESVNIHDSIKTGSPERDKYIDNYIRTLAHLGEAGIKMVCYNFMPVFDWTRSDLAKVRDDGSTVLAYDQSIIDKVEVSSLSKLMESMANGFELPGWEPERMATIKELFTAYIGVDDKKLLHNLKYFLECIMPVCEKYEIKMAIHPDDPAWSVFGLPRIVTDKDRLLNIINMVDSPFNGVTLCSGSLGSNPDNNIPEIIHALKGRIHFAHLRNLRHTGYKQFEESAHLSSDGSLDMFAIVKALYDTGFDGPARSDHGRAIWGEVSMPGYGLYDRAIGTNYLLGLWESIDKMYKIGRV